MEWPKFRFDIKQLKQRLWHPDFSKLHFKRFRIRTSVVQFVINVCLAVLLSCLLSFFVLKGLSLSPASNIKSNSDFEMSDIYIKILNSRYYHKLSDVTVVGIDGLNREEIGNLVEKITMCSSPRVIGMDVWFKEPNSCDIDFIPQLKMCDDYGNLVLASMLDNPVNGKYTTIKYSFFQQFLPFNTGTINLDASTRYEVMRNFKTEFKVGDEEVSSLPMEMIRLADDTLYDKLKKLGDKSYMIYYPDSKIEIYSGIEILSDETDVSVLDGKYVLMGDVNLMSDCFMTPLGSMPGVVIHAYALNTLLEQKIVRNSPNFIVWLVTILICILFTTFDLFLRKLSVRGAKFFIMRILQGIVIIFLIVLGIRLLDSNSIYLNIALPTSMIAIGLLSNDIIFGCYDICQIIAKQINKHKK